MTRSRPIIKDDLIGVPQIDQRARSTLDVVVIWKLCGCTVILVRVVDDCSHVGGSFLMLQGNKPSLIGVPHLAAIIECRRVIAAIRFCATCTRSVSNALHPLLGC